MPHKSVWPGLYTEPNPPSMSYRPKQPQEGLLEERRQNYPLAHSQMATNLQSVSCNPYLDIWVSFLGGPYLRLMIKKKQTVNQLLNILAGNLCIPAKQLRIYHGHRLLYDKGRTPSMDLKQGAFIRVELALPGGGTDKGAISRNSTRPSYTVARGHSNEESAKPIPDDRVIHWADTDNRPMDFSSLPPKLRTLTEAQIKKDKEAFLKQTTKTTKSSKKAIPKGKLMQEHLFWGPLENTKGQRHSVISRADSLGHRVCVILEHQGQRMYSSFRDRFQFWEYYKSYKGDRCFYWINRSFKLQKESSLLHFDIEWFSQTYNPKAHNKINLICNTIQTALARKVPLIKENLSREIPEKGSKNS